MKASQGKKTSAARSKKTSAASPSKQEVSTPEATSATPFLGRTLQDGIDALGRILKQEGNLPLVVRDSLGIYGSMKPPRVQVLDYWDVLDSNLPVGKFTDEEIPSVEPLQRGQKVVVLEMVD